MGHEQNRSMFRCVVLGMGVCLSVFLTGTISADESGVHRESCWQDRTFCLAVSFVEEHWEKLKHLLWIIPVIAVMILYYYLKRRCPECKKAWGLSYTGETENWASGWLAWLMKDEYDEYRCKHCGHKEWKRSGSE